MAEFLFVQGVTKGYELPYEAYPWRWDGSWEGVLSQGAEVGRDFERGLLLQGPQQNLDI